MTKNTFGPGRPAGLSQANMQKCGRVGVKILILKLKRFSQCVYFVFCVYFCEYFVVSLMKVWLVPALERAVPG